MFSTIISRWVRHSTAVTLALTLLPLTTAMGSLYDEQSFTIGGDVKGLAGGSLILDINGVDTLLLPYDGQFQFNLPMQDQYAYVVTVDLQPGDAHCEVRNGIGIIESADVDSIQVVCHDLDAEFAVSGTLEGLSDGELVLDINGSEKLTLSMLTHSFAFTQNYGEHEVYVVTVEKQPRGQFCEIKQGIGFIARAAVDDIAVSCSEIEN